jgi:hypothetical protein
MEAISSVNLLKNAIPVEQAQELVKIMQSKEKLITLCGLSGNEATLDFSAQGLGPGDAVLIANDISDMRALTSLHVGKNNIPEKELREIIAIAMRMDSMKILCEIPFKDKTITELDVSGKKLGTEGALVVAEYLDGNEAISSANLLLNDIGVHQAKALASILKEHPTLKSLCGNKGDETELDMSGKMGGGRAWRTGAEDAIMLVPEIIGNGALTKLMFGGGKDHRGNSCAPATLEVGMTEADLSNKNLWMGGATIFAAWISYKDNGALSSFNLAENCLCGINELGGGTFDASGNTHPLYHAP